MESRGLATLLADLLTPAEETIDRVTAELRFDIPLLGRRLIALVDWTRRHADVGGLPLGLFGASTGAAAALVAAAARRDVVDAVVCRGGRPDLARESLAHVAAPTLLIVGSLDTEVIELNEWAKARMRCSVAIDIIPGAGHLFEEPGTLDQVAARASRWFLAHLDGTRRGEAIDPGDRVGPPNRV
jgi:pimeloyl-ACP methyl ester carboxylesterase